tara:strand:+ start:2107 stop:4050 length:1944 start_codon:yes stop_codon:yes gene_type:complete
MNQQTNLELKMHFDFTPKTHWTPPEQFPTLEGVKEIAVDLETCDPKLRLNGPGWPTKNGYVCGYAFHSPTWESPIYLPVRHEGGGNIDEKIVRKFVQALLSIPNLTLIAHNAQYDIGWLLAEGYKINPSIKLYCTMTVACLIDENRFSYSLNALGYDLLGKTKQEKELESVAAAWGLDAKAELWKLPASAVGSYGEADANLCLLLYQHQKQNLFSEDLSTVFELEMDTLPCLIEMTRRGVRVDEEQVEKTRKRIIAERGKLLKKIKEEAGFPVEIWAAKSIAAAFEKLKIPFSTTEKGAPSFTKNFLLAHPENSFPNLLLKARSLDKIEGTFLNTILKHTHEGRIHAHVNQLRGERGGTVSGRLSYYSPNLQQVPSRDPALGPLIRKLFKPEEGEMWASLDFSQQEPRVALHFADLLAKMQNRDLKTDALVEAYQNNPDTDFYETISELTGLDDRRVSKLISLGLLYGMGVNRLAVELDMPVADAKVLMAQFHDKAPFIRELQSSIIKKLDDPRSSGSLRSILGRKLRFNMWEPSSFGTHKAMTREDAIAAHGTASLKRAFTFKALNRLVQSSSSDQCKKSLVDCVAAGFTPLLQIHDELCFSVKEPEEAFKLAKIMEQSVELVIPNKVSVSIGKSWGETKECLENG